MCSSDLEQKAQAGSSTRGRDGGCDARRKPGESADGKPETGSTHAARLSTMKAPEASVSGVFVFWLPCKVRAEILSALANRVAISDGVTKILQGVGAERSTLSSSEWAGE